MSYENSLEDILHSENHELYGRLLKIKRVASSLMSYTQGKFPYFTPHDFSHSLNVEENLNWLLPDKIKKQMNPTEIFFLLIATFMHDWGMIGKPEEDPKEIRIVHNQRTEKYFEELYDKIYLNEHEARIIGRISKGHTKEDLSTSDYDDEVFGANTRIRKRFLSAILRIADECDVTCNRTPEIVYYTLNATEKSKEEFEKHLSISGVGQLNEKHKIYISAITRDPKGAKTLRMVRDKIQTELDSVKGILASNGVILDTVELRMETRGFIDKPIGFEIDKKKIIDLLIGEHLYAHTDVAIRELVQNGIDACRARKELNGGIDYKITVTKDENSIVVSDNGIGMDYLTAKEFLSVIGATYYSSDEFKKLVNKKEFEPIAMFGIGILSSFLISEGLTIETKKDGFESCKFTIGALDEDWKYQSGTLSESGTCVKLFLNETGKKVNLEETIQRYFACPEIDLFYQDKDGQMKKFQKAWSAKQLLRFSDDEERSLISIREVFAFETKSYQVILARQNSYVSNNILLFSHGIFVFEHNVFCFSGEYAVFVNLKEKLIDIDLSREKVIVNEKWKNFLASLFDDIFDFAKRSLKDQRRYVGFTRDLIESRSFLRSEDALKLEEFPFLKSLINKAEFPIIREKSISFTTLSNLPIEQQTIIYNAYSTMPLNEIALIVDLFDKKEAALANPYLMPSLFSKKSKDYDNLLELILGQKQKVKTADLVSILTDHSVVLDYNYPDIIPKNVKIVRFPTDWKPIALVKEPAVIEDGSRLGSAYWGGIILWKKLSPTLERLNLIKALPFRGSVLDSVKVKSEHEVYIDYEDALVKRINRGKKQKSFR